LVTRKSKSGVSTLVGGAIIIGIVLTILTPLFISANEMTSYYDTIAIEMRDLDQQRTWEELDVYAVPSDEGVTITITNIGAISVNITRIWVYPDTSDYGAFEEKTVLKSGEQAIINDVEINNYVMTLSLGSYSIKVATDRGNLFNAYFPPPPPATPGYYFPLSILENSTLTQSGSNYELTLEVWNWKEINVTIDFLVVTTSYLGGGTPSEVKMLEVNPDVTFPQNSTERPFYWCETFSFSAGPEADVVKVELIDTKNFVIGATYFRDY
jgi:hypothetical protein